ncbi:hypothetical protein LC20004_05010 [Loigolactobacillus coryniformis subsp. torquens DSM 20004 = KCTC 3535]|uniref:Uncharacterized protein n=1 Tax=Loigolactobacillus coryniformis subsp. torquens DSM 20004 = KCTC 3535 TaxID=1423822 RepID=A0A2D1KMI2_9LACO|nr:hypothetical protein LC20004_05010 [Loigolactobacillus coryniformis subsp. torquens DSM 20004 = KCTC 3535]
MDKWLAFLNGLWTMLSIITLAIVLIADEVSINHIEIIGKLKVIVVVVCLIVVIWNVIQLIRL